MTKFFNVGGGGTLYSETQFENVITTVAVITYDKKLLIVIIITFLFYGQSCGFFDQEVGLAVWQKSLFEKLRFWREMSNAQMFTAKLEFLILFKRSF